MNPENFKKVSDQLLSAAGAVRADYRLSKGYVPGEARLKERIYCYELYHQYRTLDSVESSDGILLHGELFKSGYPKFAGTEVDYKTPDFLFHRPGSNDANVAIVEVKAIQNDLAALKRDLDKIAAFVDVASYFGGVLLIFGDAVDRKSPNWAALRKHASSRGLNENLVIAFDKGGVVERY